MTALPWLARDRVMEPERVALLALWVLALGAPQLLGGVYPWGMLAAALAALCALGAALRANAGALPELTPLDVAVVLALVYTIVQALPVPCAVVGALAPESVADLARTHALLGLTPPRFCTLSRDAGATREEIVKGVAIVAAYATARLLVQRGARRAVVLAVAGSGVLLSIVTLGHAAFDATSVFGAYVPLDVREQSLIGPVLNPNALGGALALCVPMAAALALSARGGPARVALLLCVLLTSGTLLLTRSRGAVAALALGLALLLGLALRARRRGGVGASAARPVHRLERWAVPAGIAGSLAIVALASYSSVVEELRTGRLDKLELIARSARHVLDAPWLGVGRGAFASAFAAAHEGPTRFDHPENLVVQWAAEWGVPVAAVLLAALAHAFARATRRARSFERNGAIAGVLALAAQNLVDLGLELVGVAVLGAVALACATGRRGAPAEPSRGRTRVAAGVGAAMVASVAVLAVPIHADHLPYADQELRALLARGDDAGFRERLRPAVLAHPVSPVLAVLGASEAVRRDGKDALPWINRAQAVAPGWALPHLFAAQWLWNRGHRGQALLELSIAARVDVYGSRELACAMARQDATGVVGIAARTGEPERFLELAGECVGWDSEQGLALDRGLAKLRPEAMGPALRRAGRLLARGEPEAALEALRRAGPAIARSPRGVELGVRCLLALERPADALELLRRPPFVTEAAEPGSTPPPWRRGLLALEVEVRAKLGDRTGVQTTLERLRGMASGPQELAQIYQREASAWIALDRPAWALRAYESAYSISNDTALLRAVAELATRTGDELRARRARARLCALDPADSSSCGPSSAPTPLPEP